MKKVNSYAILCLAVIMCAISFSCKKSDENPKKAASSTSLSYWYGSFLNTNGAGGPEGILFRSDGTIKVYDLYNAASTTDTTKAYDATGTYKISGTTVTMTFEYPDQEIFDGTGTISTASTPATMSITDTSPTSPGGQISLSNESGSSTLSF